MSATERISADEMYNALDDAWPREPITFPPRVALLEDFCAACDMIEEEELGRPRNLVFAIVERRNGPKTIYHVMCGKWYLCEVHWTRGDDTATASGGLDDDWLEFVRERKAEWEAIKAEREARQWRRGYAI